MKRDRFLQILKNMFDDPSSPIQKYKNEILEQAKEIIAELLCIIDDEYSYKLEKVSEMKFELNLTDNDVMDFLNITQEELNKLVKIIEEITADSLIAVIIDYMDKFSEVQINIFMSIAMEEACDRIGDGMFNDLVEDTKEDIEIKQMLMLLEKRYRKKYTFDGTNMARHKKPQDNLTIFELLKN